MTKQEISFYDKTQVDTLLSTKANSADLAPVATSGDYDDLTDKPTIPVLYDSTGQNTDGAMTQKAVSDQLDLKLNLKQPDGIMRVYGMQTNKQETYDLRTAASPYSVPYRMANGRVAVGTPSADDDATTKLYVDTALNDKITWPRTDDGNSRIAGVWGYSRYYYDARVTPSPLSVMIRDNDRRSQVVDPVANLDIANKQYVDNAVASAVTVTDHTTYITLNF